MITIPLCDRFLAAARGQARSAGTEYAREGRVGPLTGTSASVTTVVRGHTGEFEVALWVEGDRLAYRCSCPSWRVPCKHEVAAVLVMRQALKRAPVPSAAPIPAPAGSGSIPGTGAGAGPGAGPGAGRASGVAGRAVEARPAPDLPRAAVAVAAPGSARARAIEERVLSGYREPMTLALGAPPYVEVESTSGFRYRVHVRGGTAGPHGCTCPDFEANRLHTCKHVERVRAWLRQTPVPPAFAAAAARPRVFLHFGEVIEPHLFGAPERGPAPAPSGDDPRALPPELSADFDTEGVPRGPIARDLATLAERLAAWGPYVEDDAIAWVQARLARVPRLPGGPFRALLPPLGMTPYPFQWIGAEFLARAGRALLADEMGLGKTVQALLAAAALRRAQDPVRRVTVVCPASLRGHWVDEIARWLGESAVALLGAAARRARTIESHPGWLVTHYEQLLRDRQAHAAAPPDLLIVDEAQRVKGLAGKTARALKSIDARAIFVLTGTPLENRLEEAYAIAQLVDQRLLPPLWQIDRDHFERDTAGRRVVMYRRLDALRSRLAPAFLRRRKEDVALELPDRLRATVLVPMTPLARGVHDEMLQAVARIARRKRLLPPDIEKILRLLVIARRACDGMLPPAPEAAERGSGARRASAEKARTAAPEPPAPPVPKLLELEQVLRELCLGERRKVVVFSEWTDVTARVETLVRTMGLQVMHLHGDVPVAERAGLIRSFTTHDGPAVFVSTDAGGVGLNLQAADAVVVLDMPWNPARLEQRIARVHRIGSRRPVQVLQIVADDTIEHRMLNLHATKQGVADALFGENDVPDVAAPGGSGAFRAMVEALLERTSSTPPPPPTAPLPQQQQSASGSAADGEGDDEAPSRADDAGTRGAEFTGAAPEPAAGEGGGPADGRAGDARTADGRTADGSAADPSDTVAAPRGGALLLDDALAAPSLLDGEGAPAASDAPPPTDPALDPGAVARVLAALGPELPAAQRHALAAVLRSLADALAPGGGPGPGSGRAE